MKFLILRRITQISILVLFILGNVYGVKILSGNLSSSLLFGQIPLSDPFAVLQILLAGFSVGINAIIGAIIVFAFYALVASRAFCSWVCPVNLLTDIAYKLREKFGFKGEKILNVSKNLRYYLLALTLILSLALSVPAFESISFVGIIQRGIIYGSVSAIGIALGIVAFDMFVLKRGIC